MQIVESMGFDIKEEDAKECIGSFFIFYEFVTLQGDEMIKIKEKIDEFISTDSRAHDYFSSLENPPVPLNCIVGRDRI